VVLIGVAAVFVLLWLSFSLLVGPQSPRKPEFVWLTPAELANATRDGPFTRLKKDLMRRTSWLWGFYRSRQPRITLKIELFTLPGNFEMKNGLPPPRSITAAGMPAWLLTLPELTALRQSFKAYPPASIFSSMGIATIDGGHAQTSSWGDTSNAAFGPTQGMTMDVLPTFRAGSVGVVLGATSTRTIGVPSEVLQTNLAFACRATVPNTGALLIVREPQPGSGGETCGFILAVRATDAKGNLLKP